MVSPHLKDMPVIPLKSTKDLQVGELTMLCRDRGLIHG